MSSNGPIGGRNGNGTNGNGTNASGANGRGPNGREANGRGPNGREANGREAIGRGANGDDRNGQGHGNGRGADSLTPFEFALAGVTPPGADAISSLRVIDDMRSLVDGVEETPVVHPGLHDFLESGGRLSLGRDRRRLRPEVAAPAVGIQARASGGAFIDITPTDMTEADADIAEPIDGAPPMPTTAALTAATADRFAPAPDTDEPITEPPLADEADDAGDQAGDRSIDVVQADLQSALRGEASDDLDATTTASSPSSMVEQMVTGPIAGHGPETVDPITEVEVEVDADVEVDSDVEVDAEVDDGFDAQTDTAEAPLPLGSSTDGLRDDIGRFGPTPGPQLAEVAGIGALQAVPAGEPLGPSDEPEHERDDAAAGLLFGELDTAETLEPHHPDGDVIPIGAVGAGAPGLLDVSSSSPPMVPAALPAAIGPVGRRPGGTILALLGAGAAAAVLVAGSLWWATSTSSSSTEADQTNGEVAASPSTTESDIAAGSLGGSAERSTGDDGEPAEFQGDEGTSSTLTVTSSGPSTTIRSSSGDQTSTTAAGGSTTVPGGPTSESTVQVSTSRPTASTAATTSQPSTTRSTTTTPSTSTTRLVTTRPPITTTTVAPTRPIFIGDRITVGSFNGPGLGNVEVGLYIDEDRDGFGDRRIQRQTTGGNGRYSFEPDPGCYEVRFTPPAGYEIQSTLSRQALCLESGGSNARIDAVAERLVVVAPPSSCDVESDGVEVDEFSGNWADSYTFYSASGAVVARTRDLGPYDTDPGETDREWFGPENGFNHRAVVSVAAERNGRESAPRACRIL